MKINAKDLAASLFLLAVAVIGLWLNQDHALGSARRMGPGYMPMLVFWLEIFLAGMVLVLAFFNGPDPLVKWTGADIASVALGVAIGTVVWKLSPMLGTYFSQTYNGVGLGMMAGFLVITWATRWRLIGYICAAMCIFALLLEKGGLMLALIGTILAGVLAEPDHRKEPIGVLGITVFLLALCWWVFIKQLDIRVQVFPWS
ncbi:MAG: hypothetical protein K2X49_01005 [Acetobacteraceae bacterium]|nr:hypothetical protein [Acetobacteraceae bacterium]